MMLQFQSLSTHFWHFFSISQLSSHNSTIHSTVKSLPNHFPFSLCFLHIFAMFLPLFVSALTLPFWYCYHLSPFAAIASLLPSHFNMFYLLFCTYNLSQRSMSTWHIFRTTSIWNACDNMKKHITLLQLWIESQNCDQ